MQTLLNESNIKNAHKKADNKWCGQFNCWGATLYALDEIKSLKWVKSEDMREFLTSKTFNVRKAQVGDILVLYWNDLLIHTAIYLEEDYLWHKCGGGESEYGNPEKIKSRYPNEFNKCEIRRLK